MIQRSGCTGRRFASGYNGAHAALFGLAPQHGDVQLNSISNHFRILDLTDPLFADVNAHGWNSKSFPFSETPPDGTRNCAVAKGAVVVAQGNSFHAIVSVLRHPKDNAIFFSNLPQFGGSGMKKQLLYNAITFH